MFTSEITKNGNQATSFISQEDANTKAQRMDEGNNYNCYNCYKCNNCNNCNNCTKCTSQPIQILGLIWPVTFRANNTIKIGCQDHCRSEWETFTDEEIARMESRALDFWKQYKTLILSIPVPIKPIDSL